MTTPLMSDRQETTIKQETNKKPTLPIPTSPHSVFLLLLNLAALSLAFFDAKGIVILVLSLMFTSLMRVLLTNRAEQRRTNELLEELIDTQSPMPVMRE